eukprot:TRINITY_DN15064_c0_g1_i1.p1 TRINITY_DN15064_c0_g1~~TRINITY_DN15064_c0_g1_i1.p1  ORF type:complete len:350 (+),score=17.68 TRINITY_DN15064_c0_g1_i1:256-1305(+)
MGQQESIPEEARTCTRIVVKPNAPPPTLHAGGQYELELPSGRMYIVYIPTKMWNNGDRYPLVICFHGGGGNALGTAQSFHLNTHANQHGYAVMYPYGSGNPLMSRKLLTWNCAPGLCGGSAKKNIDDVGFVLHALDHVSSILPIDSTRVYCTGLSNGGMMSYRMAVDPRASQRIAAIAPIAGAVLYPYTGQQQPDRPFFSPQRRIPVMHIHSVDDPRALYLGGEGPPFPMTKSTCVHPSVDSVLRQWVHHNGGNFDAGPTRTSPERRKTITAMGPGGMSTLVHTAVRYEWDSAPGGPNAPVVHWRLTGAGHIVPGSDRASAMVQRICGPQSDIIYAWDEAWSFFTQFHL